MTSTPCAMAPSAKARLSGTPDSRMSRAMTIVGAPAKRANAAPRARVMSPSSWSGTTPRTSYALTIFDRSVTGPTLVGLLLGDLGGPLEHVGDGQAAAVLGPALAL